MKSLILCADDYGQNEAISSGIRQALAAQRINAVSCLTNGSFWPKASQSLLLLMQNHNTFKTGLHFNLTFNHALSDGWKKKYGAQFSPLFVLIARAYLKRLNQSLIYQELYAQLEAFRQTMGKNPDFIDGHQHIHQLPEIRQVLLRLIKQEQLSCFVRVSAHHHGTQPDSINRFKVDLIARLGGRTLRQILVENKIACNSSFSGVYDFKKACLYATFFKQFLNESEHNGLIMCHPGALSQDKNDPIAKARFHEFQYLMSDTFLSDLTQAGFIL